MSAHDDVIVKEQLVIDISNTVTGFLAAIPLTKFGPRGQIQQVKVRQGIGGVVTTADIYIASSTKNTEPTAEAISYKKLAATLTPSATVAAVDEAVAINGGACYLSQEREMSLILNLASVSASTASTLFVTIYAKVQN